GGRHRASTTITFGLTGDAELPDRFGAERDNGHYRLRTEEPTRLLHELTDWALSARLELDGLEVTRPSLEDVYLQLTGEDAADEGTQETAP
ncbi:MAG TPA: ABC transporter ATP-binding protein, partial [Candidatus Limnocylindria bacterium]